MQLYVNTQRAQSRMLHRRHDVGCSNRDGNSPEQMLLSHEAFSCQSGYERGMTFRIIR